MAVSVINRPLGHKLDTSPHNATVVNLSDDAWFTADIAMPVAGYVYIESNIESYNGFKRIADVSGSSFKIYNQLSGTPVPFIQEADAIIYLSVLDHGWQSAHLPIVYEIRSDLFPVNEPEESYVPRTVASFANYNGYVQLNLNTALNTPQALEFIELVGDDDLSGKYQIVSVLQPWSVVIDLAYDATFDFSGYHVLKYYNNYFVGIHVYAGLETHRWQNYKPLALQATIRLIPDENNTVRFSIADIIRGMITTRNNLTLDTLPNNIDFYSPFLIQTFEGFDLVVGGEITAHTQGTATDEFTGHAVNSSMPFKSLNESFMSDYLNYGDSLARWLTLLDRPVAIVGYFFDLSFLNLNSLDLIATIFMSLNGVVTATEIIEIDNPGEGVIRVPIVPESGYDLYCVKVSIQGGTNVLDLSAFQNSGSGTSWTTGANPSLALSSPATSKVLFLDYPFQVGQSYTIGAQYSTTVSGSINHFKFGAFDDLDNQVDTDEFLFTTAGSYSESHTFVATEETTRLGFINAINSGGSSTVTITQVTLESTSVDITEQICITILGECDDTFTNDNLRITETDQLRELE